MNIKFAQTILKDLNIYPYNEVNIMAITRVILYEIPNATLSGSGYVNSIITSVPTTVIAPIPMLK